MKHEAKHRVSVAYNFSGNLSWNFAAAAYVSYYRWIDSKYVQTFFIIAVLQPNSIELLLYLVLGSCSFKMKLISLADCVDKAGKGIVQKNGKTIRCKDVATEDNCLSVARVRNLCRKSCGLCCKYNNLNHSLDQIKSS